MFLNVGEFDPGPLPRRVPARRDRVGAPHRGDRAPGVEARARGCWGSRCSCWIGVRSYGIYLWHWPIYMVTRPHSDVPITGIPLLVIRLTLTFVAAALSYKYVEEPIRHGAIERQWAQLPRRARRDPAQADDPVPLVAAGIVVGPGDHRDRARQRRERGGAGGVRQEDRRSSCGPATLPTTTVAGEATTTPTAPPRARPPRAPGTRHHDGHRHRRLGDARRRTNPLNRHHRHDVRRRHGHAGDHVDAAENRQFSAGSTTSRRTRTRGSSARTSSCSSAPTAPSTPASSTA